MKDWLDEVVWIYGSDFLCGENEDRDNSYYMSYGEVADDINLLKSSLKEEIERRKEAQFTLNAILEVTDCSWERNLIEIYNDKYKEKL